MMEPDEVVKHILAYICLNPGACVGDIADDLNIHRVVVTIATELLVENDMIRIVGRTPWGDAEFESQLVYSARL